MPQIRRIQGEVVFPSDAVSANAAHIIVEVRDVSLQDQASTVVASLEIDDVDIEADCRIAFDFEAPSVATDRSLAIRVQVDLQIGQSNAAGDYLTTVSIPVSNTGDVSALAVPVTRL